jgi:putative hemolysin
MAGIVGPISRLVAPPRPRAADLNVEEMESLLNLSQRRGLIGQGESEMLQEVLELTDLKAADIMVPRVDMVAFEAAGGREELLELIRREKVTKIPVYEKDIDHILGVVYAKHLLARPEVPLRKQVAPVQFIPETAPLERVLMQFRAMRSQIGVVVDEYGGAAGLITLQDILEEIVGEIADTREAGAPPDVQPAGPATWLVSGDLPIHEWAEAFPTELNAARFTTVGGFVISLLGGIPHVGQSVRYHNILFTVEAMRRRRIALLRVHLKERRR